MYYHKNIYDFPELLAALGVPNVPRAEEVLLACLADSYEDIKTTALDLLTSTPTLVHQLSVSMLLSAQCLCLNK